MTRTHHSPIRLRRRLLAVSLLAALLILGGSFSMLYVQSMSTLMDQYQETAINLMNQTSAEIERLLSEVEAEAVQLQFDSALQGMFAYHESSELERLQLQRAFLDSMRQYLSNASAISAVLVMDQSGEIYGTSRTRTLSQGSEAFITAYAARRNQGAQSVWLGGHMDTDFAFLPDSPYYESRGIPVLLCARKVNSGMGLGGAILLALPSQLILDRLSEMALPSENICIVDASGIQLLGTNEALNGAQVASSTMTKSSFFTDAGGAEMHLINLPLKDGLYLMSMVPITYYQQQMTPILYTMGIIGILTLFLLSVCCVAASFSLERPLKAMVKAMDRAGTGDLCVKMDEQSSVLEFQKISQGFNRMISNIHLLMDENMRIEQEKREAEMESLQAQINPHFLFNTITSIRWIAVMTKSDGVATALTHLSRLLRPLFYTPQNTWTLGDEIEFIGNYISLMEMRFGSQVDFQMFTQAQALSRTIPRFILQPILENSYEHAGHAGRHTAVSLFAGLEGAFTLIRIEDNGQGMDGHQLEQLRRAMRENIRPASRSGSIALVNVYRRLKLCYGEQADLCLDSFPDQGFRVTIRLPDKEAA